MQEGSRLLFAAADIDLAEHVACDIGGAVRGSELVEEGQFEVSVRQLSDEPGKASAARIFHGDDCVILLRRLELLFDARNSGGAPRALLAIENRSSVAVERLDLPDRK